MWAHDTGPHTDNLVLQQFGYLFAPLILLLFVGLLLIFKSKLISEFLISDEVACGQSDISFYQWGG